MTWIMIVIVAVSTFTVEFNNEQACQTAKASIEKKITHGAVAVVVCVAKGEALL